MTSLTVLSVKELKAGSIGRRTSCFSCVCGLEGVPGVENRVGGPQAEPQLNSVKTISEFSHIQKWLLWFKLLQPFGSHAFQFLCTF